MNRILLAATGLLLTFALNAQTDASGINKKRIVIHSSFGIAAPGVSKLNDALSGVGYLPLRKTYFSRGGGFYVTFPKSRITTVFNFQSYSGTEKDGGKSSWTRGTAIGSSLGYSIRTNSRLELIPFLGVHYSFFGVRAAADLPDDSDFSDYFQSSSDQHNASANQFLLNYGLHLGTAGLGKSAWTQKIVTGLRVGYQSTLTKARWKVNESRLNNGPDINSGGWYVQFILGLLQ